MTLFIFIGMILYILFICQRLNKCSAKRRAHCRPLVRSRSHLPGVGSPAAILSPSVPVDRPGAMPTPTPKPTPTPNTDARRRHQHRRRHQSSGTHAFHAPALILNRRLYFSFLAFGLIVHDIFHIYRHDTIQFVHMSKAKKM